MDSNCSQLEPLWERYYLSPFYAVEFCLGFPGNLVVILGYVFCLPEWQSCNIYLFSLAASDLVFLCTLPRLSYLYMHGRRETSPVACVFNRYVLHVNLYSSILFMVWVCVDRFLLIRHPMKNHLLLRPRSALVVTGLSWLAVNAEVAPMILLMVQDLQRRNRSLCLDFSSLKGDIDVLGYSLGLTLTGYLLPLLGLCFCSYQIARLLRVQDSTMQRRISSYKHPLRMVTAAAVIFSVLFTPYHVMRNVRIASVQAWAGLEPCTKIYIEILYMVTRPIAFFHSVINPIFYFFVGDKFRELLSAKLRKLAGMVMRQREPT